MVSGQPLAFRRAHPAPADAWELLFARNPRPALLLDAEGVVRDVNAAAERCFGTGARLTRCERLPVANGHEGGFDAFAAHLRLECTTMTIRGWSRCLCIGGEDLELVLVDDFAQDPAGREAPLDAGTLLAALPEGVAVVSAAGIVTFANEAIAAIMGRPVAGLVGKSLRALFNDEDWEAGAEHRARRMAGIGGRYDFRIRRPDGTDAWTLVSAAPLHAADGAFLGTLFVLADVTARKRQDDQLRGMAAIVASSNAAVLSFGLDGRVTSWNAGAEALYGYTAAEVIGRDRAFLQPPDTAERDRSVLDELVLGEAFVSHETARVAANGERIPILLSGFPLRDERGDVTGFATSARDMRPMLAQRAEVARLAAIVENSEDGVTVVDRDGHFVYWNRGAARLSGYEPSDVLARSSRAVGLVREGTSFRGWFARALRGEPTHGVEARMPARDGRMVDVKVSYLPLRNGQGEVEWVAIVARDISTEKRELAARLAAEEQLHAVLHSVPVVLFACDREGEVTLATGGGFGQLGVDSAGALAGALQASGMLPPLGAAAIARRQRIDVGSRVLDVHLAPMTGPAGEISGFTGVAVDVTEQQRAERAIIQAQKLESLAVLAGGVAHDFNNLLVSMMGNAEIALLTARGEQAELLGDIRHAALRAADLARQMLAYSGKGSFVLTRFRLDAVVEEIVTLLRSSLRPGVSACFDFDEDLPEIQGDIVQVQQVVMNLLLNASEAITASSGTIVFRARRVHATRADFAAAYLSPELPEGAYVELTVADTGAGMDAETAARIFDPFFTTKFTGRGLGLAATLGIVRGHRGAIRVESSPGKGTTFTLLFPAGAG